MPLEDGPKNSNIKNTEMNVQREGYVFPGQKSFACLQTSTISTALQSCKVIPKEPQSDNTEGSAMIKHSFH